VNWYSFALFLHVSGAIGAFVSVGVWLVGLAALRRARYVAQVRAIAWLIIVMSPVMVLSILVVVGAGLVMALNVWGLATSWIAVALSSLALMAPIGPLVLDTRMRAIIARARMESDGPLSAALAVQTCNPILGSAAQTLAALLLGIVFLMTTKPGFVGALATMIVALVLGLSSSIPLWRATGLQEARTSAGQDSANGDPYLRTTFWTRRW
jgi:hypothetical protein